MLYYHFIETSYSTAMAIFHLNGALCWLSLHNRTCNPMQIKLEVLKSLKPNQATSLYRLNEPIDESTYPVTLIAKAIEDPMGTRDLVRAVSVDYMELSPNVSDITQKVWDYLRSETHAGMTTSYGAIAKDLGVPQSSRAVARACAVNKIAVIIPCHRVLTKEGGYSGYRWGVDLKKEILEREGAVVQQR